MSTPLSANNSNAEMPTSTHPPWGLLATQICPGLKFKSTLGSASNLNPPLDQIQINPEVHCSSNSPGGRTQIHPGVGLKSTMGSNSIFTRRLTKIHRGVQFKSTLGSNANSLNTWWGRSQRMQQQVPSDQESATKTEKPWRLPASGSPNQLIQNSVQINCCKWVAGHLAKNDKVSRSKVLKVKELTEWVLHDKMEPGVLPEKEEAL